MASRSSITYPFQRLPYEDVEIPTLMFSIDNDELDHIPGSHVISNWSPKSTLKISQTFKFNPKKLFKPCMLQHSPGCKIMACMSLHCPSTHLHQTIHVSCIDHDFNRAKSLTLTGEINGHRIARSILIHTKFVVSDVGSDPSTLNAMHNGTVLWEHATDRIHIEGSGGRFPVSAISFKSKSAGELSRHPDALWYLRWNPHELDTDIHNDSIRLFLNTDHPDFEMLQNKDTEWVDKLIAQDVAIQLINGLIHEQEAQMPEDLAESSYSIRTIAMNMIEAYFPGSRLDELKSLAKSKPGIIASTIQSSLGIQLQERT